MTSNAHIMAVRPAEPLPDEARPLWGDLLTALMSSNTDFELFRVIVSTDLLGLLTFLRDRVDQLEGTGDVAHDQEINGCRNLHADIANHAVEAGLLGAQYLVTYQPYC